MAAKWNERRRAIDFLHPRPAGSAEPAEEVDSAAAAAAALLALAYLAYVRIDHALLANQIGDLKAKSASLEKRAARADKTRETAAEISKWTDGNVVGRLDHFRGALSEHFPPARTPTSTS